MQFIRSWVLSYISFLYSSSVSGSYPTYPSYTVHQELGPILHILLIQFIRSCRSYPTYPSYTVHQELGPILHILPIQFIRSWVLSYISFLYSSSGAGSYPSYPSYTVHQELQVLSYISFLYSSSGAGSYPSYPSYTVHQELGPILHSLSIQFIRIWVKILKSCFKSWYLIILFFLVLIFSYNFNIRKDIISLYYY